jgi:hypothetical protein
VGLCNFNKLNFKLLVSVCERKTGFLWDCAEDVALGQILIKALEWTRGPLLAPSGQRRVSSVSRTTFGEETMMLLFAWISILTGGLTQTNGPIRPLPMIEVFTAIGDQEFTPDRGPPWRACRSPQRRVLLPLLCGGRGLGWKESGRVGHT